MKNRWLIALSAIGIHICIAILFLGLSAGFLGTFVEKNGLVSVDLLPLPSLVLACLVQL